MSYDVRLLITSREFIKALKAAGVIADNAGVQRVIIDADIRNGDTMIVMHIQQVGDKRVVDVLSAGVEGARLVEKDDVFAHVDTVAEAEEV